MIVRRSLPSFSFLSSPIPSWGDWHLRFFNILVGNIQNDFDLLIDDFQEKVFPMIMIDLIIFSFICFLFSLWIIYRNDKIYFNMRIYEIYFVKINIRYIFHFKESYGFLDIEITI